MWSVFRQERGGARAGKELSERQERRKRQKRQKSTYIPCGAFSVSRDETVLMYKLVTPMPVALTKEALREEVDICMGNAIAVCDRYADLLLKVLDGEMDKDAVMEAMGM